LYPRPTEKLLDIDTEGIKNGKQLKRSSSQIDEGAPRPYSTTVLEFDAHAWLPSYYKNPQNLRSIFWTKHHLPASKLVGEEGVREKRMEHEQRTAKKSLQTDKRRAKPVKLHRGFT